MKPAPLNRNAILSSLRGVKYRVPSLTPFFRSWPPAQTNPHYAAIVPLVNQAIDRIAVAQPLAAKRKKDDIALLTALWYPQAGRQALETLATFVVWLVCWDDCVDMNEGDLAGDFKRAEDWRARTLGVVGGGLGVRDVDGSQDVDAVNAVFQDFGRQFQTSPLVDRQRLYREISFFIESCAIEQKLRLQSLIPDFESYLTFRQGTVAGRMLCSLLDHATQEQLPACVTDSPHLQALWTQTGLIVIVVNDLLSLKKELKSNCVINVVATLLSPEKNLDDVVLELLEKLRLAVDEFDAAGESLLKLVDGNEKTELVRKYINGCRALVTGTLEFTLTSPRYQISKLLQEDGSLEITL